MSSQTSPAALVGRFLYRLLSSRAQRILPSPSLGCWAVIESALVVGIILASFVAALPANSSQYDGRVAMTVLSSLYLGKLLSYMILLRALPHGARLVLWLVIIVVLTDTVGMIVGLGFGHRPLAPRLSPGKSWEGAIAALVVASLAGFALVVAARRAWSVVVSAGLPAVRVGGRRIWGPRRVGNQAQRTSERFGPRVRGAWRCARSIRFLHLRWRRWIRSAAVCRRALTPLVLRYVAILGSTGSIGRQALAGYRGAPRSLFGCLTCRRLECQSCLAEQANALRPTATLYRGRNPGSERSPKSSPMRRIESAPEKKVWSQVATGAGADIVVAATDGMASLRAVFESISRGLHVALANKELLVGAGRTLCALARSTGARVLPVDSEHSALFQCLLGEHSEDVASVVITASGGPFWTWSLEEMERATPELALRASYLGDGPKEHA